MAKPPKLYRTAAGFHDLYVAAPSKAAALRAWGSERDLFALDMAEEVTGKSPGDAALETPGEVMKVVRSEDDDSLPVDSAKPSGGGVGRPKAKAASKPKPRPSRAKLDAAEAALDTLMTKQREARAALEARHAEERAALDKAQAAAHAKAEAARARAEAAHDAAIEKWRDAD